MNHYSNRSFTRDITTVIKGFLIVWLIMHHAIGSQHYTADGTMLIYAVKKLAGRGAAVVAVFAFLSGFGLNETYKNWVQRRALSGMPEPGLGQKVAFSYSRILRLLVSLWIVYVIFVGAIVLFRDPDFLRESYNGPVWLGILRNLTGNLLPVDTGTVNSSWWFVRAICSFYLIYPFVKCIDRKYALTVTMLSFAVTIPVLCHPQSTRIFWYFQFFLGYYCSEIGLFGIIEERIRRRDLLAGSVIGFLCTNIIMFRFSSYPFFPLFGITAAVLGYAAYRSAENTGAAVIWRPFRVLGKYSSDMYLLHVFIHGRLFTGVVYFSMNPLWVVLSDVLICLACSWVLSLLKDRTGLNAMLNRLCPDKADTLRSAERSST